LREESSVSELAQLNDELASTYGQLARLDKRVVNLTEQVADAEGKDLRAVLQNKLSEVLSEQKTLKEEKKTLGQHIAKAASAKQDTAEHIANMKALMKFMQRETGEKRIEVRQRLRHRLRSLIDSIRVYPVGNMP
jgi:chromosome segregation ATPase